MLLFLLISLVLIKILFYLKPKSIFKKKENFQQKAVLMERRKRRRRSHTINEESSTTCYFNRLIKLFANNDLSDFNNNYLSINQFLLSKQTFFALIFSFIFLIQNIECAIKETTNIKETTQDSILINLLNSTFTETDDANITLASNITGILFESNITNEYDVFELDRTIFSTTLSTFDTIIANNFQNSNLTVNSTSTDSEFLINATATIPLFIKNVNLASNKSENDLVIAPNLLVSTNVNSSTAMSFSVPAITTLTTATTLTTKHVTESTTNIKPLLTTLSTTTLVATTVAQLITSFKENNSTTILSSKKNLNKLITAQNQTIVKEQIKGVKTATNITDKNILQFNLTASPLKNIELDILSIEPIMGSRVTAAVQIGLPNKKNSTKLNKSRLELEKNFTKPVSSEELLNNNSSSKELFSDKIHQKIKNENFEESTINTSTSESSSNIKSEKLSEDILNKFKIKEAPVNQLLELPFEITNCK